MNECEKYEELCSAYLDGELTAAEQAELTAHLAVCPDCAAYMEALRQMQGDLDGGNIKLPEGLHEEIMDLVMAEAQKTVVQTAKPRRRPPVFTMLAAAVAAVVLVMSGAVGELVSNGRDMLGLDTAQMADTADAGAAAGESAPAPFSMPQAKGAATPEGAAAAPQDAQAPAADGDAASGGQDAGATQRDPAENGSASAATPAPQAQDAGGAASPRLGAAPRMAAVMPELPETPASLLEQGFAFCYVATGSGEAPSFEATYLDQTADGRAAYFAVKNDMSVLEKALADLSKGGFEPQQRDSVSGVLIDSKADHGLIIVLYQD